MNKTIFVLAIAFTLTGSCKEEHKAPPQSQPLIKFINTPATDSCGEPYLFTDKNGMVYLSYIEKEEKNYSLKFTTLAGNDWSEPTTIASGENWFVNWADYPVIAASGDGNMIAFFLEKSDSGAYTYDAKYVMSADSGHTWSATQLLNQDAVKAEHGFVSVIFDNNRYFVSWLDGRHTGSGATGFHQGHHGDMSLRAAFITRAGLKEDEMELDSRVCDCCQTTVARTAEGPLVIYRNRDENEIRDMAIVRLTKVGWSKPEIVSADMWRIEGCPVNGPRADAIGNNVGVAWFTGANDSGTVRFAFSDNGGAQFKAPVRMNDKSALGRVDLLMINDKSAMVCWMEGATIKAARIDSEGKRQKSFIIAESSQSRAGGFPQMTRSGKHLLFAWTDTKTRSIRAASTEIQ